MYDRSNPVITRYKDHELLCLYYLMVPAEPELMLTRSQLSYLLRKELGTDLSDDILQLYLADYRSAGFYVEEHEATPELREKRYSVKAQRKKTT